MFIMNAKRTKSVPEPLKVMTSDGTEFELYLTYVSTQHDLFRRNELRLEVKGTALFNVGREEDLIKSLRPHIYPTNY
jgi:hypothetical protein